MKSCESRRPDRGRDVRDGDSGFREKRLQVRPVGRLQLMQAKGSSTLSMGPMKPRPITRETARRDGRRDLGELDGPPAPDGTEYAFLSLGAFTPYPKTTAAPTPGKWRTT